MAKHIKKILNYQVLIYPDETVGSNKSCFTAYCPALEIADSGKNIEEALKNITELIKFHLESLKEERSPIPEGISPRQRDLVTTARVSVQL